MSISKLIGTVREELAKVDDIILSSSFVESTSLTSDITKYISNSGGKRVRPVMTLAISKAFNSMNSNVITNNSVYFAAAIEAIHTATLLHDDVIDESETRRGKPTANLVWSNKASILVGDYLFSQAFCFLVQAGSLRALGVVAKASSMITESEVWQLDIIGDTALTMQSYMKLISMKTASLFEAACKVGAIISCDNEDYITAAGQYGDAFGMIFQILDDLMDYRSKNPAFGKKIGNDFFEGKITAPIAVALSAASSEDRALLKAIFEAKNKTADDLQVVQTMLTKYSVTERVMELTKPFVTVCEQSIESLPKSKIFDYMNDLVHEYLNKTFEECS